MYCRIRIYFFDEIALEAAIAPNAGLWYTDA